MKRITLKLRTSEKKQTKRKYSLLTAALTTIFLGSLQPIASHGTVISPPSRVWICFQENPESPDSPACADAVRDYGTQALYDWTEINQMNANGNHRQLIMDGNLASGGRPDKYGGMDQVRDDWVSTPVEPGPFNIVWSIIAPHATLYYEIYITKADWTPDKPLTWGSLELLERTGPKPLSDRDEIPVTLPFRTGKHVIYSVWQRSLSPEAFYSTSDVDFGNSTLSVEDFETSTKSTLKQNYPNPFSDTSTIEYTLDKNEFVNLKIYNVLGEEVSTLLNSVQTSGKHRVPLNSNNLSDGIYFYVFQTENGTETKRMIVQH